MKKKLEPFAMKAALGVLSLIFFVAILATVSIVSNDGSSQKRVTRSVSPDENVSTNQSNKMSTGPCSKTAKIFSENLKPSVDPCEDFYEFACGNFGKHNPLPDHSSSIDQAEITQKEVQAILLKSLSSDGPSNEIKPLKYVRRFFKRCTDQAHLEKNDFKGMVTLDKKLRESKTVEELIVNGVTNGLHFIITFGTTDDPDEPATKNIVVLDQPLLTLGRSDLVANESDVKAKQVREAYTRFISASLKLFNQELKDTDATAKKILDLEIELAKIFTKEEDRRDFNQLFKKFSKEELSKMAPGIDLARVVDGILGKSTNDTVIVADVAYFQNLSRVLQGKVEVMKDLMTWSVIEAYAKTVSAKFNELELEFLKVKDGLKKKPDLKEDVIKLLTAAAPNVLGRLYTDTVGFDENDRERLVSMMDKLKSAMSKMIDEKGWMDNATKAKAKEKLDKMKINIGYPKWIKNDSALIKSFDIELDESQGNYEMLWTFNKFQLDQSLKKLHKTDGLEDDWGISAAVVNAGYDPQKNLVVFPAAILRGVFYHSGCQDFVNYGAIGSVIGHEVTHALDDAGSQFGPHGRLVNWWSNETLKNFNKETKKIIDQYASIVDERTKLNLNGINSQGENIADNGGLRATYQAYLAYGLKEEKLSCFEANFEGWTSQKMFFLSYANAWCEVINDEHMRLLILYDSHAPNKYRVNVPLSNFEAFAQAFQCKAGSKMNPKDKVMVW